MMLTVIGSIAFLTTTISLIPQIYRTYTSKSAHDISLLMLINFLVCSLSWVMYGILINDFCVWSTNAVWFACSLFLLALKIRYDKKAL